MTALVTAWSYSRYADYAQCPLRFKLKVIDKIQEPASPAMARGNTVHKALAQYIEGRGELPQEVKSPYHASLYAEMRGFPAEDKVVEQQMGFTAHWEPTGWFAKDTWLRVVWDLALMYEDLTGEVVDHKTGKKYGTNTDQMELFGLSFFCKYKLAKHVTTRLVYIDSGDEEIAEFSADAVAPLKAKWEAKVAPMFTDTVFAPRPNDKCRFCHFAKSKLNLCKFG